MNYSIKIGGEAGQGLQTIGHVLAKALVRGGYHVFAIQDYESRIRGGHNFYQLRFSESPVLAHSGRTDILVAFDSASVEVHLPELSEDGIVLYDAELLGKTYSEPSFLDIPLQALALEKGGDKVMMNASAAGAVLGMLGYEFPILEEILKETFRKKGEEIIRGNISAGRAGYDFAKEKCSRCNFAVSLIPDSRRMLISGNEALALGAIAAGCRFAAAYPMTPSTGVITYLAAKSGEHSLVVEQAEDEIAAINMALGASFAGVRAITATSGGGFCLMTEGISLAGMTETPLVIVLAQRPGPATGLPTRTEQGELFFALHAGHGEFPRAVMAPGTAEEAFYTVQKAFNTAEKYQTTVIVMSDQHLADSYWSIDALDPGRIPVDRALLRDDEVPDDYRRHSITESGVSPRAVPGQAGRAVVATDSDEHDEGGHIIEDAAARKAMADKRMRKVQGISSGVTAPGFHGDESPETLLIGWGSTYGAIREAVDVMRARGRSAAMLHFSEIWPFPSGVGSSISSGGRRYTVENNSAGQLRRLIRMETGIECSGSITKYDGRPFTAEEIIRGIDDVNS